MSIEFTGALIPVVSDRGVSLPASVVAIGAFDGVHQGHQSLIRAAITQARAGSVPAVVWTFDPPPKVLFGRARPLSTLDDKLARIAQLGPDMIVVASFTRSYAARYAADFMADLARINPACIHVGADFRFGAGQSGDTAQLAERFDVSIANPVRCTTGEVVSSTRIRALRQSGDHSRAAELQACPGFGALIAGRTQTIDIRHQEDPHA